MSTTIPILMADMPIMLPVLMITINLLTYFTDQFKKMKETDSTTTIIITIQVVATTEDLLNNL